MSYWTHRVVNMLPNEEEPLYGVFEVFCEDDGKPVGYTEPFTQSDTLEGLRGVLTRMLVAVDLAISMPDGVLKDSDFPVEPGLT